MKKQTIKCIVACRNGMGEPDLFFIKVCVNETQYLNGEHYDLAESVARDEGYTPLLTYDEHDNAGKLLVSLFDWKNSTIVGKGELK